MCWLEILPFNLVKTLQKYINVDIFKNLSDICMKKKKKTEQIKCYSLGHGENYCELISNFNFKSSIPFFSWLLWLVTWTFMTWWETFIAYHCTMTLPWGSEAPADGNLGLFKLNLKLWLQTNPGIYLRRGYIGGCRCKFSKSHSSGYIPYIYFLDLLNNMLTFMHL
jgi:hypothetical protein